MRTLLFYFCMAFVIWALLMVVIPYLRRKSDLITAFNCFMIGGGCFIGMSGMAAATNPEPYLQYTTRDYSLFMIGAITFYFCVVGVYWYLRWPRRLASRTMRSWPPATNSAIVTMIAIAIGMWFTRFIVPPIPGVAQFIIIIGTFGSIYAMGMATTFWNRSPLNPITVTVLLSTASLAVGMSVLGGTGRRFLVSVLFAFICTLYWLRFREANRAKTITILLVLLSVAVLFVNGYSAVRHRIHKHEEHDTLRDKAVALISGSYDRIFSAGGMAQMLGQNAVEVSLTSINMYGSRYPHRPFHTIKFVLANPVPRYFWEDKPKGLGFMVPREYGRRGSRATWGPGIVGHGFHEGGLHILILYGVLMGFFLAWFDELLIQQPQNPYLIASLAAISGQVIGWARGDIGTFTVQIIAGLLAGLVLITIGRCLFGTGLKYMVRSQVGQPAPGWARQGLAG
jgi:hypothetical protein